MDDSNLPAEESESRVCRYPADIVRLLDRVVRVDMPFPLLGFSQNQTENSCDDAASVYVAVKIE